MATIGVPGARLTYEQIEKLWTDNGGNPLAAPIMAAIALAESGGLANNLNDNPSTGDYSVGLWQINYFQGLGPARSAQYGTPSQLATDPNRQAAAAISISSNGTNLKPWSTYTNGSAQKVLSAHGGSIGPIPFQVPTGAGASVGSPNLGSVDGEGNLIDWSKTSVLGQTVFPGVTLARSTVRKVVGVGVMGGGVVIGLAALFLLAGRKAPGPSRIVQETIRSRSARRIASERETTRQEGLTQREDMRAQRRRQAESESSLSSLAGGDL